jgi:hypothetical protein
MNIKNEDGYELWLRYRPAETKSYAIVTKLNFVPIKLIHQP